MQFTRELMLDELQRMQLLLVLVGRTPIMVLGLKPSLYQGMLYSLVF
jgi:hypothetical protein